MSFETIYNALDENNEAMNVLWQDRFRKLDALTLEKTQESIYARNISASEALAELDKLKKYQWVSVEEKSPDILEEYFCISMKDNCPIHKPYIAIFDKATNEWHKPFGVGVQTFPTHWMPLPEPPVASNTDFNLTQPAASQVKS